MSQACWRPVASVFCLVFFFFQAEDGIRDWSVTGVQTCALPIFTPVFPPFMMRRAAYEGVVDLGDFESVMYKIDGEDLFLIATSEHPMGAMHMDEIIEEADLPIALAGLSTQFRREIGGHGVDTKGFFRMHQFNKVEQFVFCRPEDSWTWHEKLRANGEAIYRALEIPYRVVNVCTGDIGTVAAKKYDIEGWFPRENGGHGVDTKGFFRMHQFNKVEQFVFCRPEDSWTWHEKLRANGEAIYRALEIPYRVVNVCTGDIGTVAAKKYDIEGWFPRQNAYRE